jgi:xylulokinase
MNGLLIGVDVGTQSVKAGLYTPAGRSAAASSIPLLLERAGAERVEQDAEAFVSTTARAIGSCVEQAGCPPGDVAGVAIAGQMAGILGIGADGRAVTPYDSWLDSRCAGEVDEIDERLGDEVVELTGCPPMVAHAPKILWWKRCRPGVYGQVRKWVVPSAYVAGRLCGLTAADAFVDWTHLHFSGLADTAAPAWSELLVDGLDLDLAQLPRILAPTDVVGAIDADAAAVCGLLAGTPVAAGLGDTAAGALGAGIVAPGQLLDTAGTAAVLGISTAAFQPDVATRTLVSMRAAVPGQWIALAYLAGGNLLHWLPRALAGRAAGNIEALDDLLREAEAATSPARAGRPLFVPHLGGRILPAAPEARGAWVDVDFSHGRADLTRAVLESVAFEYAGYLERALALHPEPAPREVRVIGGGRVDDLWNRIKASVLGLPYVRLERESFGPWGAALVAGAACGCIDDLAAAALGSNEVAERFDPDPALCAVYAERLTAYRAVSATLVPDGVHAL